MSEMKDESESMQGKHMPDEREQVKTILNNLAKEHGDETFVSDGYAYYEDALEAFTGLLEARTAETTPAASTRDELRKQATRIISDWLYESNVEAKCADIEAEEIVCQLESIGVRFDSSEPSSSSSGSATKIELEKIKPKIIHMNKLAWDEFKAPVEVQSRDTWKDGYLRGFDDCKAQLAVTLTPGGSDE